MIRRLFSEGAKQHGKLLTGGKELHEVSIGAKLPLSHDTVILRCLYDKDKVLGVPLGYHVRVHFKDADPAEGRTFTPLHQLNHPGILDFLVKVYGPTPQHPKGGAMSQYLGSLKPGDKITISGPRGKFEYHDGLVNFKQLGLAREFKHITFIAGGTGITPIYQILMNLKKTDQTKFTLLFANKTVEDIILNQNLDKLEKSIPTLKIHYTVDKANETWPYFKGYVNSEMIKQTMPPPSEDHLVWICGPKEMNIFVRQQLIDCGYSEDNIFLY